MAVHVVVCASVCKDVQFEVLGEHHISAAVEAVLHSDWSADEAPSGQVPHIHRPSSDGAAHSIPASRGSQTPLKEDDTAIQMWTVKSVSSDSM